MELLIRRRHGIAKSAESFASEALLLFGRNGVGESGERLEHGALERVVYEVIQKAKEKIEASGGTIVGSILNRRKYHIPERLYRRL